jgi:hypothetical protein
MPLAQRDCYLEINASRCARRRELRTCQNCDAGRAINDAIVWQHYLRRDYKSMDRA